MTQITGYHTTKFLLVALKNNQIWQFVSSPLSDHHLCNDSHLTMISAWLHKNVCVSCGPLEMLQRLPIAFTQVKTGNTSENLLNEIRKNIYSLYQANEITEKVYYNIMNSITL